VTTHFHYDLNGLLISETDGNGNPRRDYVYLNGEPVAMKVYGGSAGWYWFVNDHLGTPQKMVDESGNVVWAAAYAPFGEARVYVDEVTNNLRFPGQYYDVETGCITTGTGIMIRGRGGICGLIRLGLRAERIYTPMSGIILPIQ
jgi:uncharacterized protein RhaS with RHS repeats